MKEKEKEKKEREREREGEGEGEGEGGEGGRKEKRRKEEKRTCATALAPNVFNFSSPPKESREQSLRATACGRRRG